MSAANWPACIAFTISAEGGLVDSPDDPGGLTNFGISQAAYPDVDIRGLTAESAAAIYARDFWAPVRGDELPAGVDLMVFDMGVNAGVVRSAKILQRCLGVDVDGVIGAMQTLPAARAAAAAELIPALGAAQLAFYESLQGWREFGAGWGERVARRLVRAKAMATAMTAPAA